MSTLFYVDTSFTTIDQPESAWFIDRLLLKLAAGKTIYEISAKRDRYWGVFRGEKGFVGANHLGQLLMKLRDELMSECNEHLRWVAPPRALKLKFLGEDIGMMDRRDHLTQNGTLSSDAVNYLRA